MLCFALSLFFPFEPLASDVPDPTLDSSTTLLAVVAVITLSDRLSFSSAPPPTRERRKKRTGKDNLPLPPPSLWHLHLLPVVQRHNVVQEPEQRVELLESSVFLLAEIGQLVGVSLADRCVEFGEGVAGGDVSDRSALCPRGMYDQEGKRV